MRDVGEYIRDVYAGAANAAKNPREVTINILERRKDGLEYDIKRASEKLASVNEALALIKAKPEAAKILELLDTISE